ncbi:MAG: HAD-IIIA family hydrolase [Acidobacteriota bacterium]|nr:HAD-IIIA family hydrolase [Acidobacteriota bacterium]MDH3786532.1 HAD-IIIA family hydrolase [Acidobacteriota bacterium]
MPRRAIFIDRDGTINHEVGIINDPQALTLIDGAADALGRAAAAGFQTIVITNQSAIALGKLDEATLADIHDRLRDLLYEGGVRLDAIYYCPHHPTIGEGRWTRACDCRKPADGLLQRAGREMGIALKDSYMIGDRIRDVRAGHAAGATAVLVRTGFGKDEEADAKAAENGSAPATIADNISAAIDWILKKEASSDEC